MLQCGTYPNYICFILVSLIVICLHPCQCVDITTVYSSLGVGCLYVVICNIFCNSDVVLWQVAEGVIENLQGESLVYVGYVLARHGYSPSYTFEQGFCRTLSYQINTLLGGDFPMILYTLARWHQDRPVRALTQPWVDDLLLQSYMTRAISQSQTSQSLTISQMSVMLRALGVLAIMPGSQWLQRLYPAVAAKIAAATAGDKAANPAATAAQSAMDATAMQVVEFVCALSTLPERSNLSMPADWLDEVLGFSQQSLQSLDPQKQLALVKAVATLGHQPDGVWVSAVQAAAGALLPSCAPRDVLLLLQAVAALEGVACSSKPEDSSISSSSSQQGSFLATLDRCEKAVDQAVAALPVADAWQLLQLLQSFDRGSRDSLWKAAADCLAVAAKAATAGGGFDADSAEAAAELVLEEQLLPHLSRSTRQQLAKLLS